MMTARAPAPAPRLAPDRHSLHEWLHHWQDESDAAYLYGELAAQEPDPGKQEIYRQLADVERRHTELWAKLLSNNGRPVATDPPPSFKARILAWLGRRFGPRYLLPLLLREEGREVKGYMDLHAASRAADARQVSLTLARESAEHAETLASLAGRSSEPWHRTESGGFLRNVVYGFNDGLTANFGLVAGVIGADVAPHVVLVAGLAGMVADALSMAVGALIPVAPFLVLPARAAAWTAFTIAMLSHFLVGAARSLFTGRGVIRSGTDMFVVGLGVAGVGYFVGEMVAKIF